MLRIQGAVAIVLFLFSISALNPAQARMYRWVDENGQVHYSDRIPPKYANKERKEFDTEGRVISVVQAAKKEAQLAAQEKKAAAEGQRHKEVKEPLAVIE